MYTITYTYNIHTHIHTVALPVATQKHAIFGAELTVEVGYYLPKLQEECALIVKGLPPIPALNPALEYYFKRQGHEVVFCEIVDQVAYLKFNEPTGERVVSVHLQFLKLELKVSNKYMNSNLHKLLITMTTMGRVETSWLEMCSIVTLFFVSPL